MDDNLGIPSVDLDALHSDAPARLDRAAKAIGVGYGHFGLVTIAGHAIDRGEVESYYDAFCEFTARSQAEKATLNRPDLWYQRGWTPPNTEQAVVAGQKPDFKECFFAAPMPLDPRAQALYPELYSENIWPENAEFFSQKHIAIGTMLHETGRSLLRGCERHLGLDAGTFDAMIEGAAHVTRSLRYLPVTQDHIDADVAWGEEHTDFNLLTLLPGGRFYAPDGTACPRPDDRCGLYLRTRPTAKHPRGRMVVGRPPAGHIVSQVGQQLEILTGGIFLATPHVIKPPSTPGYSRTSMAHFVHVHAQQRLQPLEPVMTPESIAAYRPPVMAGTYAIKTLVDIALAPQTTLDQFGYRHYNRLAAIRADGEW